MHFANCRCSPIGSRPPSPKSDTEFETQQFDAVSQTFLTGDDFESMDEVKWKWGELPESTPRALTLESEAAKEQGKHGKLSAVILIMALNRLTALTLLTSASTL